tara:strand:+ start:126 stop:455 length:330 start_codon:yes stop_codon:yes gene_type:complete
MRRLKSIPFIGWLVCSLIALVLVVWCLWQKLAIAQARIRVDRKLREAKEKNNKAALAIVSGHSDRGRAIAIESQKLKVYYEKKRKEIRAKAQDADSISDAINKAFNRSI